MNIFLNIQDILRSAMCNGSLSLPFCLMLSTEEKPYSINFGDTDVNKESYLLNIL